MANGSRKKDAERFGKKNAIRKVILILAVILILCAMLFTGRKSEDVVTAYVKKGTITEKTEQEIYFIKPEICVKTEYAGKLVAQADEGAKVAKGEVIAYIVADGMEEIFSEMKSTERKLAAAKSAVYAYTDVYPEGYKETENEISNLNEKLSEAAEKGNISDYGEIIAEMRELFNSLDSESTAEEKTSEYIAKLSAELEKLKKDLAGKMYEISAPESGIVSFYTDGTESGTTRLFEELEQMAETGDYKNFSSSELKTVAATQSHVGEKVSEGTFVARITSGLYSYVAAETKINSKGKFEFKSRSLGISGKGDVIYADGSMMIMKCSSGNATFSKYHSAKANIYISSETGMKVPVKSLTDWDKPKVNARLTVIKSGIVKYIYVEVLAYDDEYAIVAPRSVFETTGPEVKVNDIYVVNYESVKEGEMIG